MTSKNVLIPYESLREIDISRNVHELRDCISIEWFNRLIDFIAK